MQEIKHRYKTIDQLECAAIVENGQLIFDLTDKRKNQVFKTVYKETAQFKTNNSNFVYSFSDLEVLDNKKLTVKISRVVAGIHTNANGIKVYLSIKGEKHKTNVILPLILLFLITIVTFSLVKTTQTIALVNQQIKQ